MTDRELLELAAKAAGLIVAPYLNSKGEWIEGKSNMYLVNEGGFPIRVWNPLKDDGDALRLAVTLGIEFASFNGSKVSRSRVLGMMGSDIFEPHELDPYSATRRVIVRAAAEIGKLLE